MLQGRCGVGERRGLSKAFGGVDDGEGFRTRGRASTEGVLTGGLRKARKEQVSTGSGHTLVWTTFDMSVHEGGFPRGFEMLAKAGWEGDGRDTGEEEHMWDFDDGEGAWRRIKKSNQMGFSPSDDEEDGMGSPVKQRLRGKSMGSLRGGDGRLEYDISFGQKRLAIPQTKLEDILRDGDKEVGEPATFLMSPFDLGASRREYFEGVDQAIGNKNSADFFGDLTCLVSRNELWG